MANYSSIYAENVAVGDRIMTWNFSSESFQPGIVHAVYVTDHTYLYDINGYMKVANDQDIWTDRGYVQAQNLTMNDTIFNVFSHHYERIHSVEIENGNFTMYDFGVSVNPDYVAWSNLMEDRII